MTIPWKRLIRFIATDGRLLRGEPILPTPTTDLGFITPSDKLQARVLEGEDIYDTTGKTRLTDEVVTVQTILGPLAQNEVPILRCVGLNYAKHSEYQQHSTDVKTNRLQSAKLAEHHHLFLSSSSSPTRACMTTM